MLSFTNEIIGSKSIQTIKLLSTMDTIDIKQTLIKIRHTRVSKGFSQDYVANKLGVKQATYSQIEIGETKLTIEIINKIGKILECGAMYLLDPKPLKDKENILLAGKIEGSSQFVEAAERLNRELELSKEIIQLQKEQIKWEREKAELAKNVAKNNTKNE